MNETIQLTEDLAVAWEGDVEGYAPAMELWNRALVELARGLKGEGWDSTKIKKPQDLDGLTSRVSGALLSANAESVKRIIEFPSLRTCLGMTIEGRQFTTVILLREDVSGQQTATQISDLEAFGALHSGPNDVKCVLLVELYSAEAPPSAYNRQPTKRNYDLCMTGWGSSNGKIILRIGLWLGLYPNAACLSSLRLVNTGPADKLDLNEIGRRMNVVTGDNGLGKSFLLEAAWFMLTGHWHMLPAVVTNVANDASITARLSRGAHNEERASHWIRSQQGWSPPHEDVELRPGLVVYARVDGSFSVWDSHRNTQNTVIRNGGVLPPPRVYPFSYRDVMYGLKVWLDDKNEREVSLGLINEWREWQIGNKPQFALLKSILAALGPDGEPLTPGTPSRPYLDDAKDIPTIQMGYGQEVPITLAPAGVKRVAMLAYVLTWAISEHRRIVDARAGLPARSVVLLIDEPETHLHPRWQRTILPSLLKALEVGFGEPKVDVQMFVATHSPLVLASLEPHFDPALDALWKLDLVDGEVKLERDVWHKRGDANAWLTSDVFDMSSSRSVEAEKALKRAKALALRGTATPEEIAEVQAELARSLTDTDRAWRAWESFVEHLETQR